MLPISTTHFIYKTKSKQTNLNLYLLTASFLPMFCYIPNEIIGHLTFKKIAQLKLYTLHENDLIESYQQERSHKMQYYM